MGLLLVSRQEQKVRLQTPGNLTTERQFGKYQKEALLRASRGCEPAPVYKPDSVIGSHLSGTGVTTGL